MSLHNNVNYKLAITQDKLIDLLMGAATREDIAKLDHKVDKLDCRVDELRADISRLDLKFEDKLEKMEQKLSAATVTSEQKFNGAITKLIIQIEKRFDHLDAAFEKQDSRYDKLDLQYKQLILFMMASILVPIFLHFFK